MTTDASGAVTNVESINDASSVILYKGLYHVFHQCCQNHWDHIVSKDLAHWTRLPPPIVPNMNPTGVKSPAWCEYDGTRSLRVPACACFRLEPHDLSVLAHRRRPWLVGRLAVGAE